MKVNKLSLNTLKVESFVTALQYTMLNTVKGGTGAKLVINKINVAGDCSLQVAGGCNNLNVDGNCSLQVAGGCK